MLQLSIAPFERALLQMTRCETTQGQVVIAMCAVGVCRLSLSAFLLSQPFYLFFDREESLQLSRSLLSPSAWSLLQLQPCSTGSSTEPTTSRITFMHWLTESRAEPVVQYRVLRANNDLLMGMVMDMSVLSVVLSTGGVCMIRSFASQGSSKEETT